MLHLGLNIVAIKSTIIFLLLFSLAKQVANMQRLQCDIFSFDKLLLSIIRVPAFILLKPRGGGGRGSQYI